MKYATLLLGVAILMASTAAFAGPDSFGLRWPTDHYPRRWWAAPRVL
jgi:hypothetical protein